jgi:hypothetical protein
LRSYYRAGARKSFRFRNNFAPILFSQQNDFAARSAGPFMVRCHSPP